METMTGVNRIVIPRVRRLAAPTRDLFQGRGASAGSLPYARRGLPPVTERDSLLEAPRV